MALQRPKLWWQLSFNADPNDTAAVKVWTDYTTLVRKVGRNARGRQYELAQSVAADPPITWRDSDEILNPANTGSVQYPDVQPYRAVLGQGMWPNPETSLGSAVNLINSLRWKPNLESACDPSFESYANGDAMPDWLTAIGSTVPTVSTTNPQQGTKCLAYAVAATTTRQGVSWRADCVPGEQYTSSVYVRQASASTQRLSVTGQTLGYERFRTPSASTWGTAPLGGAWSNSGGANGDYTVAGEQGLISVSATNSGRFTTLDAGNIDVEVTALLADVTTSVGASSEQGLIGRYTDSGNNYTGYIEVDTSGYVIAHIAKRVASVLTVLTSVATSVRAGAGGIMATFQAYGPLLKLKVWAEHMPEPAAWTTETSDTALTSGTRAGAYARRVTSQTSPTVFYFERLYITGYVSSSTTTTTGAYVRLSVTWTATQPKHQMQITTIGTAIADTVRIDAIQHEIGASANTFSTAGPVIFPILNNYAERFPREWDAAGFVGLTATPAVDGFAALNSIDISSDYVSAVMESQPDYYWSLSGGIGSGSALETSGNNGPTLFPINSKFGVAPEGLPTFGTAITIPGDSGATGLNFPTNSPADSAHAPGQIYGAGWVNNTPGILWPRFPSGSYPTTWGASLAAWCKIPVGSTRNSLLVYPYTRGATSAFVSSPLVIQITGSGDAGAQTFGAGELAEGGPDLQDGESHFVLGTIDQVSGGNTTLKIYVDGTLQATTTVTTASLGGLYTRLADVIAIGGYANSDNFWSPAEGVIAHASAWSRSLTQTEVTALWTAGGLGNAGETSGERITRHLGTGRYAGETRISAGTTTMSPPTWAGSIDLLTDAIQTTQAEAGTFWMAPDGAAVMEGREDRWLRLTSVATFGEDVASGEIPYLGTILFDNDPTFVYANVRITRNNGAVAQGGTAAEIATARRKYFGRSFAIGADFETDTQAQYYADYTFATHKAPLLRVSAITVNPSAYPTIWNAVMCLEVGQRVTVKRRAKAANSGAGITMSADYFIESVIHGEINMDHQEWTVSFLLSPIGTVPGPSFQPWILENATYGVLDSTTILGW